MNYNWRYTNEATHTSHLSINSYRYHINREFMDAVDDLYKKWGCESGYNKLSVNISLNYKERELILTVYAKINHYIVRLIDRFNEVFNEGLDYWLLDNKSTEEKQNDITKRTYQQQKIIQKLKDKRIPFIFDSLCHPSRCNGLTTIIIPCKCIAVTHVQVFDFGPSDKKVIIPQEISIILYELSSLRIDITDAIDYLKHIEVKEYNLTQLISKKMDEISVARNRILEKCDDILSQATFVRYQIGNIERRFFSWLRRASFITNRVNVVDFNNKDERCQYEKAIAYTHAVKKFDRNRMKAWQLIKDLINEN